METSGTCINHIVFECGPTDGLSHMYVFLIIYHYYKYIWVYYYVRVCILLTKKKSENVWKSGFHGTFGNYATQFVYLISIKCVS